MAGVNRIFFQTKATFMSVRVAFKWKYTDLMDFYRTDEFHNGRITCLRGGETLLGFLRSCKLNRVHILSDLAYFDWGTKLNQIQKYLLSELISLVFFWFFFMTLKDPLYFSSTALRTLKKRARNSWCYSRPPRKKKSKKALSDFFFRER